MSFVGQQGGSGGDVLDASRLISWMYMVSVEVGLLKTVFILLKLYKALTKLFAFLCLLQMYLMVHDVL